MSTMYELPRKRGRPIGSIELSLAQLDLIRTMTEDGCSRKNIAETVGCGMTTVFRYQKVLDLR